jgi:hypothetical protein
MSMAFRRALGLASIVILAACSPTSAAAPRPATSTVVNPAPLAHLTYDCSVLDHATSSAGDPGIYLEPYDDGGNGQSRMCALDWDGKFLRELGRGLAVQQSPDGSRLLAVDYPNVNGAPAGYVVVDNKNQQLDRLSTVFGNEAIWADDSRHLCYVEDSNPSGQNGLAYLVERIPGAVPRRVATVGAIIYLPPASSNSNVAPSAFIAGPHLLACSVLADRAVLLNPATGILVVVRLSDGAQLHTHAYGHVFYPYNNPNGFEHLVASLDGEYVADVFEGGRQVPIVDVLSDTEVTRLSAKSLAGFSWDSSRAVVERGGQLVEVVEWRSGRVISQLTGTFPYARARPNSADFVVGLPSTRHQFGLDLYIVRGDGTAFEIARSVEVIGW